MKRLITSIIFLLSTSFLFAQKSDTLNIPLGKYKFLKVGEKFYKIVTTLVEVNQDHGISSEGLRGIAWPADSSGININRYLTTPNATMQLGGIGSRSYNNETK